MRLRPARTDENLICAYHALARSWCERAFVAAEWDAFDLTVLLGGSVAKGIADRYSDLDLCVIVASRHGQTTTLPSDLRLPAAICEGSEFSGRWATVSLGGAATADVHLVTRDTCLNTLDAFLSASDVTNGAQELLWVLDRGIPCFSRGTELRYHVPYPAAVQRKVIARYIDALGLHGLEKSFSRNDGLQIDEAKNTIRKCLICLGCALRGDLFWGFKSAPAIYSSLPRSICLALRHIDRIDRTNWQESIGLIESLIGITRRRLRRFLER